MTMLSLRRHLMDVRNPARVAALSDWQSAIGRLVMQGQRSYQSNYPAPPQGLTPDDCKALGFEFHNERSGYNFLDPAGKSTVRIDFSPGLRHQAVLVEGPGDWSGALLWVDAEPVPVPHDEDGNPLCEKCAEWLDERFVYARFGGLWEHPLLDPSEIDRLGDLRGVLIWDALKHEPRVELPEPRQLWKSPLVSLDGNSLRIYADGKALAQNRADRILPIE